MKIVHCIFSFNTGGAETMLIDIVNEQIKTQEVTVVIVNHIYHKELIAQLDKKIRLIFIGRFYSTFIKDQLDFVPSPPRYNSPA